MKNILITGANRGIGLKIVEGLLEKHDSNMTVIFTSRNENEGLDCFNKLKKKYSNNSILYHQLDIENITSVQLLCNFLLVNNLKVNLVNNAAYMDASLNNKFLTNHIEDKDSKINLAIKTFSVNLFSTANLTLNLIKFNLIDSKIINVSSSLGNITYEKKENRDLLVNAKNLNDLTLFYNKYIDSLKKLDDWKYFDENVNPIVKNPYSSSKMALNAFTKLLANNHPEIESIAFSPGWCKTRMGGDQAPRTSEEGASVGIYFIDSPKDLSRSGKVFYSDLKEVDWTNNKFYL